MLAYQCRRLLADPAKATMLAGWVGRIVAALAQFGAIRILTQMLGVSGYGAYAVVTGLLAWFMLADLGLGAALQNHISARRADGENSDAAIWSISIFLTLTTGVCAALLAIASPWAGPFLLERPDGISRSAAQWAFFVFGTIISATAAANIVLKVFFAQHRGYLAHAITAGAALLGLIVLVMLARMDLSHGLVWAIIGFYLPGWLVPAAAIAFDLVRRRNQRPKTRLGMDFAILARFWPSARWFLLFATLSALTLNLDYVILSRTVSAGEIAIYSVFAKISMLVITLFASVLSAYWPVSSELIRRRNYRALWPLIRRALLIGTLLTFGMAAGMLVFRDLIGRLLSPQAPLALPIALVPAFALYCLARVWTDTFSMVIASADRAWVQCLVVPVQAGLSLSIGYWGAMHYGLIGLMVGQIVSFLLTVTWALPLYVRLGIAGRAR